MNKCAVLSLFMFWTSSVIFGYAEPNRKLCVQEENSIDTESQLQSLLSAPSLITDKELAELPFKMIGGWISPGRISHFYLDDNITYLFIEYWGDFPEQLASFANQFRVEKRKTADQKEFNVYVFEYADKPVPEYFHNIRRSIPVSFDGTKYVWAPIGEFSYCEQRKFSKGSQTPVQISYDDLIHLISQKKIIFFTGTGLGKIAGVPSRGDFEKSLGLNRSVVVDDMINRTITDPETVAGIVRSFCKASYDAEPTKAHFALANFAKNKSCQILCDNDDFVLEKTGIKPIKLYEESKKLEQRISLQSLKDVEVIVCLGLSYDHKGILSLYKELNKELNPNGKILSIDLKQPCYLSSEDLYFQGDLKTVLPEVLNLDTISHR